MSHWVAYCFLWPSSSIHDHIQPVGNPCPFLQMGPLRYGYIYKGLSSTAWVHGWKNKLPLWPALLIDHKISPSSTTDIMPFALLASPKKEKLILGVFQQWKLFHMTASAHAAPGCLLQAAQEQLPFLLFSLRQVNTFSSVATKCLDGCREFLDVKLLGIFCNSSKHGGWEWWTLTFLSLIGK